MLAVLVTAMLVFGATLALAAAKAGKYAGTTSEGGPVTLTIAANKKTITHFDAILAYNGKCGPGGGPGLTAAPATISIGQGGSFSENVRLTLHAAVNVNDPGRVFGKASGSKVTGTIEQFLKGKVNKCYVETFTAQRG
ncbi:MAG TPA: hypothetical protein VK252_02150 [Solirubrobacteraceae bacterium]|nr:hypothetical protein [Solirubrobacteraceae bacterium]